MAFFTKPKRPRWEIRVERLDGGTWIVPAAPGTLAPWKAMLTGPVLGIIED
jgi:hypothetical protein